MNGDRCDSSGWHGGRKRVHRLHSVAGSDLVHDRRTLVLWLPVQRLSRQPSRPGAALRRNFDGNRQRCRNDGALLAAVLSRRHHVHFRGIYCTGWLKKVGEYQMIKNRSESY